MLDRLLDLLLKFASLFQVFFYVDQFDCTIVLRFGKYQRTVGPGARWIWPLGAEETIRVNVVPEPMYVDTQSVYTKDGYLANFCIGLIWKVQNPKNFLVDNEDSAIQINLLAAGIMRERVTACTWKYCESDAFLTSAREELNKKIERLGAFVTELKLIDMASGHANRLWIDGVTT